MSYDESDLIMRYFNHYKKNHQGVKLGIGDDCALLMLQEKQWLAISTDTLVSGTHFLPNINAADLAYKALAVNLSDLAAMGAEPIWLSLALTLPEINETWLKTFSDSLFRQLDYYHMQLIGGDTTYGKLSLTLTIYGQLPAGKALTRAGASVGNRIYVSGTLGDSAAGLALLQNRWPVDQRSINDNKDRKLLIQRHLRPQPRIYLGLLLRNFASAVIDISDGLVTDLQHILKTSNCSAYIELDKLPYSETLKKYISTKQASYWALNGGEDYELCFTVPEINCSSLETLLDQVAVTYTCIGQIISSNENIKFFTAGRCIQPLLQPFKHFTMTKVNEK
ncbi:thiamine-phosphate kinase [Candidatus Fukatsuia anoeciicola]|uniref:thiamine-phosphate kinase n=1 Tax=Candidatus Fukatsuia anoeciicola TaxID=2994492 RepID=UPI003464D21F